MHEGIFGNNSFTIPVWRTVNSSCTHCYPSSCANEHYRARTDSGSLYDGFDESSLSSNCRCLDCWQKLQGQRKYYRGKPERSNYRSGIKSSVAREIPINIVNQGIKQDPRFDRAKRTAARKHHPKTQRDSRVGHASNGNGVGKDLLPGATYLPEDKGSEKLTPVLSDIDTETEKTENDSPHNTEMMAASLEAEKTQDDEREVKQLKLEKISKITVEAQKLAEGIRAFQGKEKSKEYLYLEEMLMKCLLRLDEISTEGISEIRKSRKEVATVVNEELKRLEEKLEQNSKPCTKEILKLDGKNVDDIILPSETDLPVDLNHEAGDKGSNILDYSLMKDENTSDNESEEKEPWKSLETVKNEKEQVV